MEWLLGGGALVGALSTAGALWGLFYFARKDREDLHKLIEAIRALDEEKVKNERLHTTVEERDAAISALQNDVARERAARKSVEGHMERLLEDLARSGDARGSAERVRRSVSLLAELSGVPGKAAPADSSGVKPVHGADPARPGSPSGGGDVPRPDRPRAK